MSRDGDRDPRFRPISLIALNWKHLSQLYVRREGRSDDFITKVLEIQSFGTDKQEA